MFKKSTLDLRYRRLSGKIVACLFDNPRLNLVGGKTSKLNLLRSAYKCKNRKVCQQFSFFKGGILAYFYLFKQTLQFLQQYMRKMSIQYMVLGF